MKELDQEVKPNYGVGRTIYLTDNLLETQLYNFIKSCEWVGNSSTIVIRLIC